MKRKADCVQSVVDASMTRWIGQRYRARDRTQGAKPNDSICLSQTKKKPGHKTGRVKEKEESGQTASATLDAGSSTGRDSSVVTAPLTLHPVNWSS